ncbi:MAG: nucleoside deaminase [Chloroflexota bacterium]
MKEGQTAIILQNLMHIAIHEAKASLREGNSGFGALIVKNGEVIAKAHDTDRTDGDPTAHAEMKVIRSAAARLGKDLTGCLLVSTHEPCPMCSTAALWAGIEEIAFGYSIKDALKQGRRRVDLTPREIFALGGKEVQIYDFILFDQCSLLYDKTVREHIEMLRDADEEKLKHLANNICSRRLQWFNDSYKRTGEAVHPLDEAYGLFLSRLGITADEAPIAHREDNHIVIHSRNMCPTLEACDILGLDTRFVCRHLTEKPTNELIRQLNPRLRFFRNYERLRPYADYCEEIIALE